MKTHQLPVAYSTISSYTRKKVREQYVREQDGKCYWCHELLNSDPHPLIKERDVNLALFPPHFLKYPVHLQHNHDTDMTEGAVHARCNAVMWQYHGR
jgi:hypothetical protein|tara:strand:+ start:475 stop:765 length:291 start_codon:yes stop_codon:yes gene_type:complete